MERNRRNLKCKFRRYGPAPVNASDNRRHSICGSLASIKVLETPEPIRNLQDLCARAIFGSESLWAADCEIAIPPRARSDDLTHSLLVITNRAVEPNKSDYAAREADQLRRFAV